MLPFQPQGQPGQLPLGQVPLQFVGNVGRYPDAEFVIEVNNIKTKIASGVCMFI
jgi:hypothetical protein